MMEDIMDIDEKSMGVSDLKEKYLGLHFYLYSQHSSWNEASKVNVFYGIWKRVLKFHPKNMLVRYKDEAYTNKDGALKCWGLAEINDSELDYIMNHLSGEFDNCVFISPKGFDDLYEVFSAQFIDKLSESDFFNREVKTNAIKSVLSDEEMLLLPDFSENDLFIAEKIINK